MFILLLYFVFLSALLCLVWFASFASLDSASNALFKQKGFATIKRHISVVVMRGLPHFDGMFSFLLDVMTSSTKTSHFTKSSRPTKQASDRP